MDRELFGWKIFPALDFICKKNVTASKELSKYLHKQIWSPKDRKDLLESLASIFLQNREAQFGHLFRPVLLDIVTRGKIRIETESWSSRSHQDFCIALSYCLQWPDIQRFTLDYMKGKQSFTTKDDRDSEPKRKKARKSQSPEEAVCRAAWTFTHNLGPDVIPVEDMFHFLSHDRLHVKWYACLTIMEHQKMMSANRDEFLKKHFTDEEIRRLKNLYHVQNPVSHDPACDDLCIPERSGELTHTRHIILETDLCDRVVCVGGVILSKMAATSDEICLDLLPVPSNETNLHSLALAVSAGRPVLLQGVVGSGKTTLVEHLGRLTGRSGPPHLLKIQLGDQMDSKALLGTYRCTEVPGEFIWQPGVLTQAVSQGYWVLLEDIDFAPMEVVSVLLPLLETRTLTVPGHGDRIRAAPGFHLFATQRLIAGSSGWQRQQSSISTLLDKLWTTVLVEPLSRGELAQVLCTKYPQLDTVVDKLLDIYFLLSAGGHQGALDASSDVEAESVGKFLSHDGRQISTRDLMTWCSRISKDFDVTSTKTANLVFQEAVDCFASCLSKPSRRMPLAEAIGAKINITNERAEYFCLKYKPDISLSGKCFSVGRVTLPGKDVHFMSQKRRHSTFSYTRLSSVLLEKIAVCVGNREPVLLVGETGTGKTSSVQYLAEKLGHKLHVINMNQQSDSADLLGGFKPVDLRHIIKPFFEDFELLFCKTFSRKQNIKFIGHLGECFGKRRWETLFSLMEHTTTMALKKFEKDEGPRSRWEVVTRRLSQLKIQVKQSQSTLAFTFMEGMLVKAIQAGDWVLLDEINLAATETLECLGGLLESVAGSVILMERGDIEPVVRHPDFRLFACMNPATDVGKKDLSPGIRNRFTELYVDELEDVQDLKVLVSDYLQGLSLTAAQVDGIVKFYLVIRGEAVKKLTDGTGHPPHFSLRTLCRALRFAAGNSCGSVARSLYEGFCLSFLTQLDRSSHPTVETLISQHVVGRVAIKSLLKQGLPEPPGGQSLKFEGYWISQGEGEPVTPHGYILTPSVRQNLRDLARVVAAGKHPVLIQGETSVGKTSLIKWLAQSSGNLCVRVNNHEHTDLQEYVGCYAADEDGKLVFKEGVLVEAMKRGHWIILDELNLAPTDVLEALNRLLDDNRELYIPETQETVKAHPKFMLFATQNPPGHYGGRKMLSRAFRNRFIELHFDEIPSKELETILHERCSIPMSYAKRLVAVMLELQMRRRGSGVFAGKMGFMTLRDLFRWAERYRCPEMDDKKYYDWDKHLAEQGYMLLAGRVRRPEEAELIQEVVQKHFKCKISAENLFTLGNQTSLTTKSMLKEVVAESATGFQHVVWTDSMRRMAVLIGQAIRYREPVLLVGETGCGKTTICQMYAALYSKMLHSVNCHLHTESADFLGGLRPVRSHSEEDKKDKLFEWVDGPLVQAMRGGAMFLIDEISLADDSVLERLNSVLEPERTILLAEKGGGDGGQNEVEQVVAKEGFQVFATMNPGGDFGKKELSPALRNRFTEIWCPQSNQRQDLINIIEHNLHSGIHLCNQEDGTSGIGRAMMDFITWFANNELGKRCTVSIRDILTWVHFINTCATKVAMETSQVTESPSYNQLDPAVAYIHGACLVFLDGLGSGTTSQGQDKVIQEVRVVCLKYLLKQVNTLTHQHYTMADLCLLDNSSKTQRVVMETENMFCIPPFSLPRGPRENRDVFQYALQAPGTCLNAQRVLRALQLPRPLLLEGSPGVGKTSLVGAIARAAGRELVRINLSEQTDVTDLFGADLPVEGEKGGVFAWRDGPLLQALKAGSWVVLDELNLASQSVLEGLNACLDHRAEVYVPELGKTFHIQHEQTRLFACQNPLNQGGGRKGLPRSFLNRFTQVYVEPLTRADLMFIATTMYPGLPTDTLTSMIEFNMKIHQETVVQGMWGQRGSPWEFNLRDLFRWCDLILHNQRLEEVNPGEYVSLVYADRMRTQGDKQQVFNLYKANFPEILPPYEPTGMLHYDGKTFQLGHSFLKVRSQGHCHGNNSDFLEILHHSLQPLESLMKCVEMNWMTILVGSQASGKSSVVEMLAQLTGNQLNVLAMNSAMDTTELLGGFEQADIGRHIEETASDMNKMVGDVCERLLLGGGLGCLDTVAKIQQSWREFTSMQTTGDRTSSLEELGQLKSQVASLISLAGQLRKVAKETSMEKEYIKVVTALKTRLRTLKEKLAVMEPGKGGGAFEWTDSILVTSLKQGHWLLIDNVNFCSASVLDRLNALLEPSGVLSINERGVIDGQIPTIKPHPNFRLFLAMDPKHGEISRAMRNRGVEIYIPGETEGNPFSEQDLRLIFTNRGLKSKAVFDWLLALHGQLSEELPRGDKPSLQKLGQVCGHAVDHCNHGYSLEKAVWTACYTEYVQGQRHRETRQKSLLILTQRYEEFSKQAIETRPPTELGVSPVRLPSVGRYLQDPGSASICRNSALLAYLLESAVLQEKPSPHQTGCKVKYAVNLALGLTQANNVNQTVEWFQKFCKGKDFYVCNYVVNSLPDLHQHILEVMAQSNYSDTVKKYLGSEITDHPLDLRWNQQLLARWLLQCPDMDLGPARDCLEGIFNRLHMTQYVTLELCLVKRYVQELERALQTDKDRGKQTVHPAIVHLVTLFPVLCSVVKETIPGMTLTDYDNAAQVIAKAGWIVHLYKVAALTLTCKEASPQLCLFWKWFHTRALPSLVPDQREGSKMTAIVSILQALLGKDDKRWKLFVKFWQAFGHPGPFRNQHLADQFVAGMDVLRTLALNSSTTQLLDPAKVKVMVNHRQLIFRIFSFLNRQDGEMEDTEEFEGLLEKLHSLMAMEGLYSQLEIESKMQTDVAGHVTCNDESDDTIKVTSLPVEFVQLWPLFEYSLTVESWNLVEKTAKKAVEDNETFSAFASTYTCLDPMELNSVGQVFGDRKEGTSVSLLNTVLVRLRRSATVCSPHRWLHWTGNQPVDGEEEDRRQYGFHQCVLSTALFDLLSRADNSVSLATPSNVKLNAALRMYKRELAQLSQVSCHVWCHAGVYSRADRQTASLDSASFITCLRHTLCSLGSLLDCDPDLMQQYFDLLESMSPPSQDKLLQIQTTLSTGLTNCDADLLTLVSQCITSVLDLVKDDLHNVDKLAVAWIKLGQLNMELVAPRGPVDPVEKVAIKLQILREELQETETELEVYGTHHRLVTGQELIDVSPGLVHPRVSHLVRRAQELTTQIEELVRQVAYRPTPSQYSQLMSDIQNYMSSVGSVTSVAKLLGHRGLKGRSADMGVLQEMELWEVSQDRFVAMLQREYPCYRDLTTPFTCAANQMVYGMHLMSCHVKQQKHLLPLMKAFPGNETPGDFQTALQSLVLGVGKFPTLSVQHTSCVDLAMTLTSDLNLSLVKAALVGSQTEEVDPASTVTNSILESCLHHIRNEALTRGHLSSDLMATLTQILELFVLTWQQQEQRKKDREEMEASLYRFKSEVHGDERTEDERLEQEFKETFPQFHQDYQGLMEPSLEETLDNEITEPSPPTPMDISDLQMTQICSIHQELYKHLVPTDWYPVKSTETLQPADWARPLLCSYTAAATLCQNLGDVLSSSIDHQLLGGHLVVTATQQQYILHAGDQGESPLLPRRPVYDIYHDSNVPEVIQCLPVLHRLTGRVQELQQEWPDHPTLKQLLEIVERIEGFPITAPVMKFLAGLELLLQKAQDWESNATQHVSMATQLSEMSALIVQWRKLELSCWMNVLETESHKYRQSASHWWFHLYQILHSLLHPQEPAEDTEDAEDNTTSPATVKDVTKALKQFMEQGSLGDFQSRLDMVLGFHFQLVAMDTGEENHAQLVNILWNIHRFYSQFVPTIQAELTKLKSPIEKELKGFVKIARWSDINYWALKQATEKTHKTLHKHIKQFQVVLRQPVQGILGDPGQREATEGTAGPGVWVEGVQSYQEGLDLALKQYKAPAAPAVLEVPPQVSEKVPLLQRLPQLCVRVNGHWRQVVATARYTQHVVTLDQFIGEMIENIEELQSLEINRTEPKEKQKSAAKHINLRKRKGLSDLFKYLSNLGISYRKGLSMDLDDDSPLLVAPLDLSGAPHSNEAMAATWEGCARYFYTCVSRMVQFSQAMLNPSKELGVGNIERCRGFVKHLYQLMVTHFSTAATLVSRHTHIGNIISAVNKLLQEGKYGFPQDDAQSWLDTCKSLCVQLTEGLNQFLVILHCSPVQDGEPAIYPSPLPVSQLHQMALAKHGDGTLLQTVSQVKEMLKVVQVVQQMLGRPESSVLFWSDVLHIKTALEKFTQLQSQIKDIIKLFSDPDSIHSNAFTDVLHFLDTEISKKSHGFFKWFTSADKELETNEDSGKVEEFSQEVESLISDILIVVQKLSKNHVVKETEQDNPDDEEDLPEGLLVQLLQERLEQDSHILNTDTIFSKVSALIHGVSIETNQTMAGQLVDMLRRCSPLLSQYQGLVHHHAVCCLATQRTVGKLLSVLLNVFTDLATKGFCIPPEFSDELEGEGATEFRDIEDGGMGEGEGVKNVSDQIEDEDQLDEAKRPEDHKEDQSNQPDVKSEENAIEMSEDIDAKVQDLEDVDKQKDDEEEDKDGDEEEIDKQIGDVDEEGADKLDEQMWGSDDEEPESKEEEKEESGPGDGKQSEPELVAKDDNQDKTEGEDKEKGTEDKNEEENEEEQKQNNLDQLDQDNYDDDQVDPYHGKQEEEKQAPEDMDLPDDLKLDDADNDGNEGETEQEEEAKMETDQEDDTSVPPDQSEEPQEEGQDNKDEEEAGDGDEEKDEGDNEGVDDKAEGMESESTERQEEEGEGEPGLTPQEEERVETEESPENTEEQQDTAAEHHGITSHDTDTVEQSDTAQDQVGESSENNQQETDGTGQASVQEQAEGHQGQISRSAEASQDGKRKKEREPGQSDSDRSLGSTDQKFKRLKTTESSRQQEPPEARDKQESDLYEHVRESESQYDAQTLDVATAEQQEQQEDLRPEDAGDDEDMDVDRDPDSEAEEEGEDADIDNLNSAKLKPKSKKDKDTREVEGEGGEETEEAQKYDIPGEIIQTSTVARGHDSTIHTAMENLNMGTGVLDLENLRAELENRLGQWNSPGLPSTNDSAASDLWHRYEALTSSLSQDLCEQLRLVLEPTQATKLKGDYRTGKRLNMRKVIAYIASEFRKDKIWLRRTKPSKRQYQVMLAIDDSSSMVDNHSKQMAFESLALISNALTLLEAGQLSICSFGETVNVLHPFTDQFTSQSGAHLLQYLTFEQTKTKIAHLLNQATMMMMDARQQQQGSMGNPETSQLLLIVSDGRGLFMEGMEVVKTAVRQAREANVFIVFVIIDNPVNKDSILDIKVPVFKQAGQIPEIKSYMDSFPFPFYVILRDINSLPSVLSDALRQWFELVTALDM